MAQKSKKILIVDDEPNNLNLMMQILQKDYILSFAVTGAAALEAVYKVKPDLILLDIMMPGMDGYEICQHLQADENTHFIPIIFVTAKSSSEDEEKGLKLGAVDYITKPLTPPIVRARVKNILALTDAREEIRQKNKLLEIQNEELKKNAVLQQEIENITRHDLKNPLMVIIGYPQVLIEDEDLPEDCIEALKRIEAAGLRMLSMINLSLDLLKMERGTYTLIPAPIDIIMMIKLTTNEFRSLLRQNQTSIKLRVNGDKPKDRDIFIVQGEELLCYSMLANLIKNAAEAAPSETDITIDLEQESAASLIRIHNQGVVPKEIRDHFFEKFVTSGKEKGTGLGTYSARMIAHIHGGSIHMESTQEKGTVISIRLPDKQNEDE